MDWIDLDCIRSGILMRWKGPLKLQKTGNLNIAHGSCLYILRYYDIVLYSIIVYHSMRYVAGGT